LIFTNLLGLSAPFMGVCAIYTQPWGFSPRRRWFRKHCRSKVSLGVWFLA